MSEALLETFGIYSYSKLSRRRSSFSVSGTILCSSCKRDILQEDLYCRHCGHRQERICESAPDSRSAIHIQKARVPECYPPLEGRYMRGNDYSPVAVAIILSTFPEEMDDTIKAMVSSGLEAGAALSGTIQTENIGIETMVTNIVANPNIRYLILGGPESPGHQTGNTLLCLRKNGVDEKRFIIEASAPTPYLYNLSTTAIERFREQITIIDLLNEGDPGLVREAVRTCIQESPAPFRGLRLWDCGAFPGEPVTEPITWRITQPWYMPRDEGEQKAKEKVDSLIERLRRKQEERLRESLRRESL